MNIFGLNPVVVFGTDEQKRRMLPPLIEGREKACFAVTEPNVGLDTTRLKTRAIRDGDHYVLAGEKVWISTAQVADRMLILARTTPLEDCPKPTFGLSLFYTKLDRALSRCARSKRWAARPSIRISCSSTDCAYRSKTASAKRAAVSSTSCTG